MTGMLISPQEQMAARDPWINTPKGWPPDAVNLADLVRVSGRLHGGPKLPRSLVGAALLERPWPVEPLDERVVDLDYAAWIPPVPPKQAIAMDIVSDKKLRYNDKEYSLWSSPLRLVNMGLMVGRYLLPQELGALAGCSEKTVRMASDRLGRRFGFDILQKTDAREYNRQLAIRLNPLIRFTDLRD